MSDDSRTKLRGFIGELLLEHGDRGEFTDAESLFLSGRLDSFSMMRVATHLEDVYGVDFSKLDFDVSLIDSLVDIERLADSAG